MKRVITEVIDKTSVIDETDPLLALRELLGIYVEEANLHQLLGDTRKIDLKNSEAAVRDLAYIDQAHAELKAQLSRKYSCCR